MKKLLILVFFTILFSEATIACTCGEIEFKTAIDRADQIFVGKLVKTGKFNKEVYEGKKYYDSYFVFEVTKKWKGDTSNRVRIYQEGHSCDPYFRDFDTEYIIYSQNGHSSIKSISITYSGDNTSTYAGFFKKNTSHLCSRTMARGTDYYYQQETDDFDIEYARLDSVYTEPIKLHPYWLNFKGFLVVLAIILPIGYVVNEKLLSKEIENK